MNLDNIILIIPNIIKEKVLKEIENNNFKNIKILSFNDLKKGLFFDYNHETIYYIMNKLNIKYEIAKEYINNLYYIDNSDNEKMNFLRSLKEDLDNNNKLIYDNLFINLLKNYDNLIIYNFDYISSFNKYLLSKIENIINIKIINKTYNNYKHNIYYFDNIYNEISFICEEIKELIEKGITLDKIYISNYKEDYDFTIKHIFNLYNIPYSFNNNSSLYKTSIGNFFINNLKENINDTLDLIKDKFNLNNEFNKEVYDKIISILNNYTFIDNKILIKDLLKEELKKKKVTKNKLKYEVRNIDLLNNTINDDEYVFLINFDDNFPKLKKDEDYLTDKIKPIFLDKTDTYNKDMKDIYFKIIKNIKNLSLTYNSNSKTNYLIDNNFLTIKNIDNTYSNYSNNYNKVLLAKKIDNLIKYNTHDSLLDILYSNYKIDYLTYNHKYKMIDNNFLIENINNNLNLSYSNISSYYECPFKFYVANILKINEFETKFTTYIGSLFHYVLEKCIDTEIDIDETYYEYIKNNKFNFTNKDNFFIELLLEELHFVIETIRKQSKYSSHNKTLKEQKIEFDIENDKIKTKIKGFIDKMLICDNNVVIIDYKTGSTYIDRKYFEYGMYLQLPIYIYLVKNFNKDYTIVGIYLEHILNSKNNFNPKIDYLKQKEDALKLDGLTLKDESKIKLFDNSYEASSVINKLKLKKDGNFYNDKIMITYEEIDKLYNLVESLIKDCLNNITSGNFDISPLKVGNVIDGCMFCEARDICFRNVNDFRYKDEIKDGDIDGTN